MNNHEQMFTPLEKAAGEGGGRIPSVRERNSLTGFTP